MNEKGNFMFQKYKDIIAVIVYFIFIVFPPTIELIGGIVFDFVGDVSLTLSILYMFPIITAILFYKKEFFKSFAYFKRKPVRKILKIFLYMILIIVILGKIDSLLNLQTPENEEMLRETYKNSDLLYTVLMIAFLVPFLEEVIYRKILIKSISHKLNEKFGKGIASRKKAIRTLSICFSLGIFTFMHVNAPQDIFSYLPIGGIITLAYVKSGDNLACSWSLHMLNNLIATLAIS